MDRSGLALALMAQASPPATPQSLFDDIQRDLYGSGPWIAALVLGIVVYLIVAFSRRKTRGGTAASLDDQPFLDLDRARRTGLLNEEEMSAVKRKLAATYGSAADDAARRAAHAAELLVLFEEKLKTGGLDAALSPAERAEVERLTRIREEAQALDPKERFDRYRDKPAAGPAAGPAAAVAAADSVAQPTSLGRSDPVAGREDAAPAPDATEPAGNDESFGALDPLAQREERPEVRLDAMLAAGAITRTEYDELRAFYRKKKA